MIYPKNPLTLTFGQFMLTYHIFGTYCEKTGVHGTSCIYFYFGDTIDQFNTKYKNLQSNMVQDSMQQKVFNNESCNIEVVE